MGIRYKPQDNISIIAYTALQTPFDCDIVQWLNDIKHAISMKPWLGSNGLARKGRDVVYEEAKNDRFAQAFGSTKVTIERATFTTRNVKVITRSDGKETILQLPVGGLLLIEVFRKYLQSLVGLNHDVMQDTGGFRVIDEIFKNDKSRYTIIIKTDTLDRITMWLYNHRLPTDAEFFADLRLMLNDGSTSLKASRMVSYLKSRRMIRGKTTIKEKDPEEERRFVKDVETLLSDQRMRHKEK